MVSWGRCGELPAIATGAKVGRFLQHPVAPLGHQHRAAGSAPISGVDHRDDLVDAGLTLDERALDLVQQDGARLLAEDSGISAADDIDTASSRCGTGGPGAPAAWSCRCRVRSSRSAAAGWCTARRTDTCAHPQRQQLQVGLGHHHDEPGEPGAQILQQGGPVDAAEGRWWRWRWRELRSVAAPPAGCSSRTAARADGGPGRVQPVVGGVSVDLCGCLQCADHLLLVQPGTGDIRPEFQSGGEQGLVAATVGGAGDLGDFTRQRGVEVCLLAFVGWCPVPRGRRVHPNPCRQPCAPWF